MYAFDIAWLNSIVLAQKTVEKTIAVKIAALNLADYAAGKIPLEHPIWARERQDIEVLLGHAI